MGSRNRRLPLRSLHAGGLAARAAGIYLLLAGLWIVFSDRLAQWLVGDPAMLTRVQTYKGGAFVLVTGLLLGLLVYRYAFEVERRNRVLARQRDRLAALNRIHTVLSEINGALLRIRDAAELRDKACRILVEAGGLAHAALVERARDGTTRVRASAGDDRGWSRAVGLAGEGGPSEPGEAVDERLAADQPWAGPVGGWFHGWPGAAREAGFGAMAVLPVRREGGDGCHLVLHAQDADFFHAEEMELLEELAADTGIGLDLIEKSERLDYLALFDPVTGLANRRQLAAQLSNRLADDADRIGLALVNVQGLHEINGLYGRGAGDSLLRRVARRLVAEMGGNDRVARVGSHEFGVVLTGPGDPARQARRVLALFPLEETVDGQAMQVSARIGLVEGGGLEGDGDSLIRRAQVAAREAEPGEIRHHTPDIEAGYRRRHRLEKGVRTAMERNRFELAFQPVVEIADRRLFGFEALLRWNDPDLGAVSPAEFIPVIERTGLIDGVGNWVLETAAAELVAFGRAAGDTPTVTVNVSVRQLYQPGLYARLRELADQPGFEPAHLGLEITETSLLGDFERASRLLGRLRELGYPVYLDDFGTGYASLDYLARLPVDRLKIDRGFVTGLGRGRRSETLVQMMLSLAEGLEMDVVAEGVETEAQRRFLHQHGCRFGQGYLFDRPLARGAAMDRLRRA